MRKLIIIYCLSFFITASIFVLTSKKPVQKEEQPKIGAYQYISAAMDNCHGAEHRGECLKNAASDFLEHFSLSDILRVFEQNEKNPSFFSNCHETAHYLGREEYRRKDSISKVFDETSRICLGGVFHGAVEGYLIEKHIRADDYGRVKEEIPRICGRISNYPVIQPFVECHHGLGHAVMFFTENDLPKALDLCDALGTEDQRSLCYTGAFMANLDSVGSTDHPTKYAKADDPLYPCYILKKQYQSQCYTYGVLVPFQSDIKKSIELCGKIPEEFKSACFQTFGRDRTMVSADPEEIKQQCYQISETNLRSDCVQGAAYNLVIRFGSDSPISFNFCSINEPFIKTCYRKIGQALRAVSSGLAEAKEKCNFISEDKYRKICQGL